MVILRGNNPQDRMSALGQKRTLHGVRPMSALPPKADISFALCDSRPFTSPIFIGSAPIENSIGILVVAALAPTARGGEAAAGKPRPRRTNKKKFKRRGSSRHECRCKKFSCQWHTPHGVLSAGVLGGNPRHHRGPCGYRTYHRRLSSTPSHPWVRLRVFHHASNPRSTARHFRPCRRDQSCWD